MTQRFCKFDKLFKGEPEISALLNQGKAQEHPH